MKTLPIQIKQGRFILTQVKREGDKAIYESKIMNPIKKIIRIAAVMLGVSAFGQSSEDVRLTIATNVVTNLVPVSVTYPVCDRIGCAVAHQPTTNYSKIISTNRIASFTFEGKTYQVEINHDKRNALKPDMTHFYFSPLPWHGLTIKTPQIWFQALKKGYLWKR